MKNIFDYSDKYASILSEDDDVVFYYGEETKSEEETYFVMIWKNQTKYKISKTKLIRDFDLKEGDSPVAFLLAGIYVCVLKEVEIKEAIVKFLTAEK